MSFGVILLLLLPWCKGLPTGPMQAIAVAFAFLASGYQVWRRDRREPPDSRDLELCLSTPRVEANSMGRDGSVSGIEFTIEVDAANPRGDVCFVNSVKVRVIDTGITAIHWDGNATRTGDREDFGHQVPFPLRIQPDDAKRLRVRGKVDMTACDAVSFAAEFQSLKAARYTAVLDVLYTTSGNDKRQQKIPFGGNYTELCDWVIAQWREQGLSKLLCIAHEAKT